MCSAPSSSFSSGPFRSPAQAARLRDDIRSALFGDELRLDYQPVRDLTSGRILGLEGLVRWDHPDLGEVVALDILRAVGAVGCEDEFATWCVRRAATDRAWLLDNASWSGDILFSINVSDRQLAAADYAERHLGALAAAGLAPQELVVEIAEPGLAVDGHPARATIARLQAAGCVFGLDNFGRGRASFEYLNRLPMGHLKINPLLTRELPVSERARQIVKGVGTVARTLGAVPICEGLETESQRHWALEMGIDDGQGFLLGAATSVSEIAGADTLAARVRHSDVA